MKGQRVILKVARPKGSFKYFTNLMDTQGTVLVDMPDGGALIRCDADENCWSFPPSEFEVIGEEAQSCQQ